MWDLEDYFILITAYVWTTEPPYAVQQYRGEKDVEWEGEDGNIKMERQQHSLTAIMLIGMISQGGHECPLWWWSQSFPPLAAPPRTEGVEY